MDSQKWQPFIQQEHELRCCTLSVYNIINRLNLISSEIKHRTVVLSRQTSRCVCLIAVPEPATHTHHSVQIAAYYSPLQCHSSSDEDDEEEEDEEEEEEDSSASAAARLASFVSVAAAAGGNGTSIFLQTPAAASNPLKYAPCTVA
jgi:hypothetical protein